MVDYNCDDAIKHTRQIVIKYVEETDHLSYYCYSVKGGEEHTPYATNDHYKSAKVNVNRSTKKEIQDQ